MRKDIIVQLCHLPPNYLTLLVEKHVSQWINSVNHLTSDFYLFLEYLHSLSLRGASCRDGEASTLSHKDNF